MPLVKCPDCGNNISPSAPSCPHCGRPQLPPIIADARPTVAKKKASPVLIALVILGAVIWGGSLVRNYTSPSLAQSPALQPTPANLRFGDMIRQQHMKCESVLEVRPTATGQDIVICEDQGDEYVY